MRETPPGTGFGGTTVSLTVGAIMSSPVVAVKLGSSAYDAATMLKDNDVHHLVVVGDRGAVVGVVSDRDLRAAQPSYLLASDDGMRNKALAVIRVDRIMSSPVHTAMPEESLRSVLRRMLRRYLGCVPVVDAQQRPVGIITGTEVLRLALDLMGPGS